VNDNETWEHYLSKLKETNVINFGVGNYGVDQALLRMQREYQKNKTETVILGVVPDTISRIVSIWKHYSEYGNTFGFKPRFIIKDNQLQLIQNPIDETLKFHKFENYLDYIKENDFFYKNKFKKDILNFPYCITILKNIRRNFAIIYWILKIQSLKNSKKDFSELERNPMKIIMRINLEWRIKLFQDKQTTTLLKKIMEEFLILSQKNNFKAILIILPQKDDVNFIKNNFHFYEKFLKELNNLPQLQIIDVTKDFLQVTNLDNLYSEKNEYGGHYSQKGNQKIASIISYELAKNSL
jgi:hypothetical protein